MDVTVDLGHADQHDVMRDFNGLKISLGAAFGEDLIDKPLVSSNIELMKVLAKYVPRSHRRTD